MEASRLILTGEADVVDRRRRGRRDLRRHVREPLQHGTPVAAQRRPPGASRPFDADRDGFVFGEGAVVMVLESAAHARARGATIYGEVAGGALTCDAFHMSAPEPSGRLRRRRPSAWPSSGPGSPPRSSATSAPTAPARSPTTPAETPGDPAGPRRGRRQGPDQLAEIDGGPPDRRRRDPGGDGLPARDARLRDPADDQPRATRS